MLHWLLSVELIIHMVGGEEWKPPTAQKKNQKKKGKSKDMATREQVVKQRFTLRTAASALSDEGDSGFLQTRGP